MSDETEALKERIKQLEAENRLLKKVNGVEFKVHVDSYDTKVSNYACLFTLHMKKVDSDIQKFVLATITGAESQYHEISSPRGSSLIGHSQRFILSSSNVEQSGDRTIFYLAKHLPVTLIFRILISVQTIEPMEVDNEAGTVIVVKNKEFLVSAPYLSMWSRYFRAYFSADMKEKQEGRYPIKDEDIEPEDFEELLLVIYPSNKPITVHNFRKLLMLASRFEMPELARQIECYLIDFHRHNLNKAVVFKIAVDYFTLKMVQSVLLQRWSDPKLMQAELLNSKHYDSLAPATKVFVNERFASACIAVAEKEKGSTHQAEREAVAIDDEGDAWSRDDWSEDQLEAMFVQMDIEEEEARSARR